MSCSSSSVSAAGKYVEPRIDALRSNNPLQLSSVSVALDSLPSAYLDAVLGVNLRLDCVDRCDEIFHPAFAIQSLNIMLRLHLQYSSVN